MMLVLVTKQLASFPTQSMYSLYSYEKRSRFQSDSGPPNPNDTWSSDGEARGALSGVVAILPYLVNIM